MGVKQMAIIIERVHRRKPDAARPAAFDKANKQHNQYEQVEEQQYPQRAWTQQAKELKSFFIAEKFEHNIFRLLCENTR